MSTNLKNGSKGDEVKGLQDGLKKLGFDVDVDGHFGPNTEAAVKTLQGFFGYDVDGIAGEGTQKLVTAQLGFGWNAQLPNAKELALKAQGKGTPAVAAGAKVATPAMSGGAKFDAPAMSVADEKIAAEKKKASGGAGPTPGGHTSKT